LRINGYAIIAGSQAIYDCLIKLMEQRAFDMGTFGAMAAIDHHGTREPLNLESFNAAARAAK
jgi:hypothetical protein